MGRLLFIGSTVADVIIRVPGLPGRCGDMNIRSQQTSLGGCAFNAFSAARLSGGDCVLFSPIGTGIWGDYVRRNLEERGIQTAVPPVQRPNGCCYCFVEDDGERTFISEHGAEYFFEPDWFRPLENEPLDGVYLCGLEVEETTGDVPVAWLEQHPPKRLFFAPGPRLGSIPPERLRRLFALHPLLHLNEEEATGFTGCGTVEEAAMVLHGMTGAEVLVTLGKNGAYLFDGKARLTVPGIPARVQDTIGAGDSHVGALMAGLSAGLPFPEAIRRANRMSAAVVEHTGAVMTPEEWQDWNNRRNKA